MSPAAGGEPAPSVATGGGAAGGALAKMKRGLWGLVAAAGLHVAEEFLLDWRAWAEQLSGLSLTWDRFWVVNAAFLALASGCAAWGLRRPVVGTTLPCLVLINGVFFHIAPTVVTGRISPGVFTSAALYVPIASWTIWHARRSGLVTGKGLLASAVLAASIMGLPFLIFA